MIRYFIQTHMTHQGKKKMQMGNTSEGFRVERGKENRFGRKRKALSSIRSAVKDDVGL